MTWDDTNMHRYVYALVRCVPDPRTGEFVNVAAIAGDPQTGDWSMRQVSNESRARRLAGRDQLEAVHRFLGGVGERIDEAVLLLDSGPMTLDESWLETLHQDYRNVVQLTAPAPIAAADAEQALDSLFASQVIDPQYQPRQRLVTKASIVKRLNHAYTGILEGPRSLIRSPELYVGAHVHTPLDFAVAAKQAVQITTGWSFRIGGTSEQAVAIKAWAFAVGMLRGGDDARVITASGPAVEISSEVEVEVVVAEPETSEQVRAYEEATQVFKRVHASVRPLAEADDVARRAAELLGV